MDKLKLQFHQSKSVNVQILNLMAFGSLSSFFYPYTLQDYLVFIFVLREKLSNFSVLFMISYKLKLSSGKFDNIGQNSCQVPRIAGTETLRRSPNCSGNDFVLNCFVFWTWKLYRSFILRTVGMTVTISVKRV